MNDRSYDIPQKLYKISEVAEMLRVNVKTVRRYVDSGMFENLLIVRPVKRRRVLFTDESLAAFIQSNSTGLQTAERPKRVYNRRIVKGRHKKPKKKVA